MKKIAFAASVVLFAGLLIGAYFLFIKQRLTGGTLGAGEKTVTLEIITEGEPFRREIKTDGDTVFAVLTEMESEIDLSYNTDYGAPFVTGFLGVEAEGEYFYAFFVNGKSSMFGVADVYIADGDVISFMLTKDWQQAYPDNSWAFYFSAGLLLCVGAMAYVIVSRRDENS